MRIKQISVFVGNEPGRLVDMLTPLYRNQINIRALSVAETADFGIVRMVVSDPDGAVKALDDAGFTLRVNEVLAYKMPNIPGALLRVVVDPLTRAGINLEYVYVFVETDAGKAMVVLKVNDLEQAERVLEKG